MEKEGFKSFDKNFKSFNDIIMEPNKIYEIDGEIKYHKHGYHFASRLEDTLRYVNGLEEEVKLCKIKALGLIDWYDDEYYGYYDLGCTNKIYIDKLLTREEIIDYALNLHEQRLLRFIQGYKLTKEELELFKSIYKRKENVLNFISYFQEKDYDVFKKKYTLKK